MIAIDANHSVKKLTGQDNVFSIHFIGELKIRNIRPRIRKVQINIIMDFSISGFEKLIFNTAITKDPELVREAIRFAGAQSIVASVDFKHNLFGKENCYIDCGLHKINKTAVDQVKEAENLGVGEIFLNSIDKDGTMSGYDFDTIRDVCQNTKLPVICCGGAKSLDDMYKAVHECGTQAVAAGSLFVYYGPRRAVLINYPSESEQNRFL